VFDIVRTVCRNVERGDQRERWLCYGLPLTANKFQRIDAYREPKKFVDILNSRFGSSKVTRKNCMKETIFGDNKE
jgi:hypothetical protein